MNYNFAKKTNLTYVTFNALKQYSELVHGFSTRTGGNSQTPYHYLNLGLHVGDDNDVVIENRKSFFAALGINVNHGVSLKQVHGNKITIATFDSQGKGMNDYEDFLCEADGMLTNTPNVFLTTYYADCVPIYLYDPIKRVAGIAHAGWKGTLLDIVGALIKKAKTAFGVKPEDCQAVIGPSIGPCCYQVDEKLCRQVELVFPNCPELFQGRQKERITLNLWKANRLLLESHGLLEQHISISGLCTSCRSDLFYSYRRDQGLTGRMAAVIGLRG